MANDSVSLFGSNAGYLAELYELYRSDPTAVDPEWAEFFRSGGFPNGSANGAAAPSPGVASSSVSSAQATADSAVTAFRRWGHRGARLSPVVAGGLAPEQPSELRPSAYLSGKKESELALAGYRCGGQEYNDLPALIQFLERVYCGTVGFEFEHLTSRTEREWLQDRIEARLSPSASLDAERRRSVLEDLIRAEVLESEIHKKYVGAKWFSVQGNDTLVPMLNELLRECARTGVAEAVFGMAHRGRINVLANVLKKPLVGVFALFEDKTLAAQVGAGDVKYHVGYEANLANEFGSVRGTLVPNPSHLEFVNPVVEGIARAKQDVEYGRDRKTVLSVLMHGDAAFAGQGIVFESINYSGLEGYTTGGTLHIVINNQIGFTTTPDEGRSTRYCTDLAKGVDAPVFHVNAEDPEAALWVIRLALEYRNTFGKSVFVDLIGHRKYGHNEADDPSFTQPLMYGEIKEKRPMWEGYAGALRELGVIDESFGKSFEQACRKEFADAQSAERPDVKLDAWSPPGELLSPEVTTAVPAERLRNVARSLVKFPEGFEPHPKLAKIIQKRVETVEAGKEIEWGVAEALAFGTLIEDGAPIRLSGQDCRRGTFSHRHLVLDDYTKPAIWSPMTDIAESSGSGGRFDAYNSSLSESAIVGFEFGYASIERKGLTLWEAQFGDFGNGAQVIIDQFISSSEAKWDQFSGVTMLLPHGYEGMGPEHSSARLERYLQLCAQGNMSVCYPSTAAQYFHLIRRQGSREIKRPLIVMTPKSLLRLPSAMSDLGDFTNARFEPLLVDTLGEQSSSECDTIVFTVGKVYHDLTAALKGVKTRAARIARVEELYPFPAETIQALVKQTRAKRLIWLQEEPKNQGAWSFISPLFRDTVGVDLMYIGRPAAAATATGSAKRHAAEQKQLIDEAVRELSA